jgi:hypothetical protein
MPTEYKYLHGSTVTMPGRPSLSLTVIDFQLPDRTAKEIPDTDLASTVEKTFSGNVVNEGELQITARFIPGTTDPIELIPHTDETIRVTLPLATGQTTAGKIEFTGHVMKATGPKASGEDRCLRSVTIKVNTKPVFTAGS